MSAYLDEKPRAILSRLGRGLARSATLERPYSVAHVYVRSLRRVKTSDRYLWVPGLGPVEVERIRPDGRICVRVRVSALKAFLERERKATA